MPETLANCIKIRCLEAISEGKRASKYHAKKVHTLLKKYAKRFGGHCGAAYLCSVIKGKGNEAE
jgi:hypothetical protein